MAAANPDFRYVNLPDDINLSDPERNALYAQSCSGFARPGNRTKRAKYQRPWNASGVGNHVAEERSKPGERNQVPGVSIESGWRFSA